MARGERLYIGRDESLLCRKAETRRYDRHRERESCGWMVRVACAVSPLWLCTVCMRESSMVLAAMDSVKLGHGGSGKQTRRRSR